MGPAGPHLEQALLHDEGPHVDGAADGDPLHPRPQVSAGHELGRADGAMVLDASTKKIQNLNFFPAD